MLIDMPSHKRLINIFVVLYLVLVGASGSLARSDWPQYQYNAQHIGYNPDCVLTPPLHLQWSRKPCNGPMFQATVVEDRAYVATIEPWYAKDSAQVWCYSLADGEELWTLNFGGFPFMVMQPSYGYGMLYLQVNDAFSSFVTAVTPDSGHHIWLSGYRQQDYWALAPTIYDGKVVICGNTYGGMHGFNAYTGEFLWKSRQKQVDEWTPAAYDGVVYSFLGDHLVANDLETGAVLWDMHTDTSDTPGSKTASARDPGNAPVIDTVNNILYCTANFALYAVDLETREVSWMKHSDRRYRTTPALYDGKVYAVQEGVVKMFNGLTGDSLAAFVGDEEFYWYHARAPVIANGFVFVSSREKTYALDAETLEEVWRYDVRGHLSVGADHLFVSTPDGELYAFGNMPTAVDDDNSDATLPGSLVLHQNYPNPFNNSTVIEYALPRRSQVAVTVYNILGRRVSTLLSSFQSAGTHSVEWTGTDDRGQPVSSGTYFYRLKADDLIQTRKMVLLR